VVVSRGLELRARHAVTSNRALRQRELLGSKDSNQTPTGPFRRQAGSLGFFQASMPPRIWQAEASPA
jgi:hypothetical protein